MAEIVHSRWGASGFSRIAACRGSLRQSRYCENSTNPAAELGTSAHELGEYCLGLGFNAFDCLGLTFNGNEVDAAMADAVQLYVAFIRNIGSNPMIETRVTISSISPEIFGTSDCIFIIGDTLHVYDYKHGYGVVEIENNYQAVFYALGALDTFQLWGKIKNIRTGIIQPRADHVDGNIRTKDYTIDEMHQWLNHFKEIVNSASNPDAPLNAGEHCTYCLASGDCRPRIERTMKLAFGEKPFDKLNEDEIVIMLKEIGAIKRNLSKIEMRALELARNGKKIEGYKLVNTISRAVCEDEKGFIEAVIEDGVPSEKMFQQKLISMTNAKKIVKPSIVNQYYIKPPASTTLVKHSDKRAAIAVRSQVGFKAVAPVLPDATNKFKPVGK